MAGGPAKSLLSWSHFLASSRKAAVALALGASVAMALAPAAQAQPRATGAAPKPASKPARKHAQRPAQHPAKSAEPARRAAEAEGAGFTINGRRVRVDVVKADGDQTETDKSPAVLILHGAHGLGDGALFYPQAKALADRGISAFVVHYFDGIPQSHKASPLLRDERERVIEAAVSFVSKQPYVDPDRIGIFGLSLGGFHALSLGSRDPRIQAVVDVVGAMPAEVQRQGVHRMPPTLILHGDRDGTVPVRRAYELANLLQEVGAEHEMKIYHGQGHTFRGEAREDSISRTVDFFERYLGDHGLLDKELKVDIVLAPIVPENETLPIRQFTIADEKLGVEAEAAGATDGNSLGGQ
ncbi:MAG TPA: prolyl oligopeptidase family serine peptidase [Ferrovibrio sp.]|uniref:alpha/beta hydrolase family protein n=1 Tax=Ferrovibrio sp. TaxID=1917215 RepID=UPI002ED4145E